jgi:hypothetical protein
MYGIDYGTQASQSFFSSLVITTTTSGETTRTIIEFRSIDQQVRDVQRIRDLLRSVRRTHRATEDFYPKMESVKARLLRERLEREKALICSARLFPPRVLETLYRRPPRVGRACGSRHRVMFF